MVFAGEAQKPRDFNQNNVILSFSNKKHAESFINFVKKQVLDPKRAKFDQKSEIGHVRAVGTNSFCIIISKDTFRYL